MTIFEKMGVAIEKIIYWRKKKKEEKEVFYMQASGSSILKSSNFQDHAYMQTPMKQMGLDKGVKLGTSQFGANRTRSNVR